jgi:hypothetical protein
MKRERLHLPSGMSVETGRDWNGRWYVAYRSGCSMLFREVRDLRGFLKLPVKTPSREALDSWLASLAAADNKKGAEAPEIVLVQEESSFDPLCHGLDETDPNFHTRTVL